MDVENYKVDLLLPPLFRIIFINSKATKAIGYIYNSTGALVHRGAETAINLGHLPSGLYLIKTGNSSVRFVKI